MRYGAVWKEPQREASKIGLLFLPYVSLSTYLSSYAWLVQVVAFIILLDFLWRE